MKSGNTFFSFFSNIKDKINSFFTSVSYSSKNDIKDLNYITAKKQSKSTEDNNYITYLLGKTKKNNYNSNFHQNKKYPIALNHRYSLNEDSNLSSTLSEISSQGNYDLNDTQIDSNKDIESILSFYNNDIEEEQDFKNYYRYNSNSNILGNKHIRYQLEEESFESLYYQEDRQKEKGKERKNINKKKKSKTIHEKNYKDVKRLCDEYFSYKKKLKLKNKINKNFQKKMRENDKINIKEKHYKENNKFNKIPFNNLFSTNPERFSLYSTHKKMKLDKKETNSLSITTENNIMLFPSQITGNKENKINVKQEDKTNGILNVSPVEICEISKITNMSNDFSFKESNETKFANDVNLSTLIDENNYNSSYAIQNTLEQNNIFPNNIKKFNINNTFPPINNSYNSSFITNNNKNNIDLFMDVEECSPLVKNKKQNNESKKNIDVNSIQITTNNNPFLFPKNTLEKKNENIILDNVNSNINSNISNKKPFFEGKNLFNTNDNNVNNKSNGLNFSFGKV